MATVFALLDTTRARDIFQEAGKKALSTNPVVRGIIDQHLGHVSLATTRPQDEVEEKIIRVETKDSQRALSILPDLPGVVKVGCSFDALTS